MFMDEAEIYVEGGRGGDGCASFLREKYRPRGGPDGGDGGGGGDVVLQASKGRGTLSELHKRRQFRAGGGVRGSSRRKAGRRGEDIVILVPAGTVVRDREGNVLADLVEQGQKVTVARGGGGGRGNASLVREAGPVPGFAEKGEPGEERTLELELKLVADVAVVGFPNAGKSTLVARISRARPKIADYPFTTREPHPGVVEGDEIDFVVTDVPGLIPGASEGRGMGTEFLRHVERASAVLVLADTSPMSGREPADDLRVMREELGKYSGSLLDRVKVVAANKMDLGPPEESLRRLEEECSRLGLEFFAISAVSGEGIAPLLRFLESAVAGAAPLEYGRHAATYTASGMEDAIGIEKEGDRYVVKGRAVERLVRMTDWGNEEARMHLARKLSRSGVEETLARAGAGPGDEVEIAGRVFEYIPEGQEGIGAFEAPDGQRGGNG